MVRYAQDTSAWEGWPPAEVAREFDALRPRHDPRALGYCPTHVSVSDALRREMTAERAEEIGHILCEIELFLLHYHKPMASPERRGVAYRITPREPIDYIKAALHAASVFEGQVYRWRRVPPHMTIAEFISIEEGLELCARLQDVAPAGSFLCDRLELVVPDEQFRFERQCTFGLRGASRR